MEKSDIPLGGDQAIAVKRTICNWIAASGSTAVGFNSNKISFSDP